MIRLSVTTSTGRSTFLSDRTEILVGSREGADLRIEDAAVAPNHCLLRVENGALTLVDLGSPDGVQFAGQLVRQASVGVGSAFRLGDVLIEVEQLGAASGAVPPPVPPVVPPARQRTSSDPRGRTSAEATGRPAPASALASIPAAPASAPISTAHAPDFGRELRETLAKAPWYAVSAIVHALVLFILWQIPYRQAVTEPGVGFQSVRTDSDAEEPESATNDEPDIDDLAEEMPDEDFDDLEDKPETRDDMPAPMEVLEERPIKIGIATPNYRVKLTRIKGKSLENGETLVDRGNIQGEQERASAAVQRGIGRGIRRLRGLPANRIVIVKGEFDEMETVLSLYKVPHITIERAHLVSYSLRNAKVLCLNCGRSPTALQKNVLVKKIKAFVERGGWLITSDWTLAPYLTSAFPGFVEEVMPRKRQTDTTVVVEERQRGSPLLRDVFGRRSRTVWWLEEASKFVGVKSKTRVKVLVYSADMKQRYGSGIVAVTFRPRRGRVLHLMGHFYQKDGNHAGVVAMHRLIFNFLQERFPQTGGAQSEPE